MEEESTLQTVIGLLGNGFALFFFFSPIVVMWQLFKRQIETSKISYLMLIANIMNCLLWFIYGIKKSVFAIYLCNSIGGITSTIYLMIFWVYFVDLKIPHAIGINLLTLGLIGGISALFYYIEAPEKYEICGYAAVVFNIIMYAAPGQKIVFIKLIFH
jgi:hypothetical protein